MAGLEPRPTALTFRREFWQETSPREYENSHAGSASARPRRGQGRRRRRRRFLNGLVTNDIGKVAPGSPRFAALLTPQGKIIVDFIVAEAEPDDGGGFFLDCPRALAPALVEKLNFYKLRAKVAVEDLSAALGVMAVWDGAGV